MRGRRLALAALASGSVVLVHRAFVTSAAGQRLDQWGMERSVSTARAGDDGSTGLVALQRWLDGVSVPVVGTALAGLVAVALRRGRSDLAVAAVAVVAGANATTQVLKRRLHRPDLLEAGQPNSFPSGHVTAVAGLAAGAVLVAPPAGRPLVLVVGTAASVVTAAATLALGWHRPSDTIGAAGVVAAWTAATAAVGARRGGAAHSYS